MLLIIQNMDNGRGGKLSTFVGVRWRIGGSSFEGKFVKILSARYIWGISMFNTGVYWCTLVQFWMYIIEVSGSISEVFWGGLVIFSEVRRWGFSVCIVGRFEIGCTLLMFSEVDQWGFWKLRTLVRFPDVRQWAFWKWRTVVGFWGVSAGISKFDAH